MFYPTLDEISSVLRDYGIMQEAVSFTELERCNDMPGQTRVIVKACLHDGSARVIRFKNEPGVTLDLVEQQSRFAALLREEGIITPLQYRSGRHYARQYAYGPHAVIVTVEDFVEGQLQEIDVAIAEAAGRLLAKMHNIAQRHDFHVNNGVLFDPFTANDLFLVSDFVAHQSQFMEVDADLCRQIMQAYERYMAYLAPLRSERRYAVQGDLSDCNLYRTVSGDLGIFDFNRSGDHHLFCDAVMEAVFVARLMAYPAGYGSCPEPIILPAFLQGYHKERPFSSEYQRLYPYLSAIIHAFWSADIKWRHDSLLANLKRGNHSEVRTQLSRIHRRLLKLDPMPI